MVRCYCQQNDVLVAKENIFVLWYTCHTDLQLFNLIFYVPNYELMKFSSSWANFQYTYIFKYAEEFVKLLRVFVKNCDIYKPPLKTFHKNRVCQHLWSGKNQWFAKKFRSSAINSEFLLKSLCFSNKCTLWIIKRDNTLKILIGLKI